MNPIARLPIEYSSRADAAESAHISRALTQVESTVYETMFEPTKARMFIPVDSSDAPGAEWTSYVMLTAVGVAKLVTSRGMDLPKVNLFRKEWNRKYWNIGAQYDYTLDELRNAEFAGQNGKGPVLNLDMTLAKAAKRAIEFGLDKVGALGSATSSTISGLSTGIGVDVGMIGLLNQPNAGSYTPATGAQNSTAWSAKTPDEILADLNGVVTSMEVSTRQTFTPRIILLPVTQYRLAVSKRMGDGSDASVLDLFKKMNPGVQVESWNYCAGAGTAGVDRAVAFINDEQYIAFKISIDFEQCPVEYRNRDFKTDCLGRTAGVVARYPVTILYMDGI